MKKNYKNMSLIELLIEHEKCLKRIEEVKDPAYIDAKAKEIFGNKKYITDEHRKKLNSLVDELL